MDKPWLNAYPSSVPAQINLEQYQSVVEIFSESTAKFGDRPAFHNLGTTISYQQLDDYTRAFASWCQHEAGLVKGDRIAIMMPNLLQYPVAVFGALRAGLVVVNTNPLYTDRELEHQLKDSGAKAIVVVEAFASTLEKVIDRTDVTTVITTRFGDMLDFPKSILINLVLRYVKKMVPPFSLPGAHKMKAVLAQGAQLPEASAELTLDDLAFLQYTGGTTGVAKGAMLTHRNMVANIVQAWTWINAVEQDEGNELIVTALPLYHIFALTANCLTYMKLGAMNLLITNPRDMPGFVKELGKFKFTAFTGVNTLFNALMNTPGFEQIDFSSLKSAYNDSIGVPIPSTEASIRDTENNPLPAGESGELCIRGPQVMKGYWQRPEETAAAIDSDGWLHTGDIAIMNEDGFFKIVDRLKDMILVSGFNVYPNEIEMVLSGLPGVLEVGAIGVPDEHSGEVVKVVIVRNDQSLTEADVIAYCKEELTGYKRPKVVQFVDEIPKTNVGKILRRELREL